MRQGPLVIDLPGHSVTRDGAPVHLTPTEFDLLVIEGTGKFSEDDTLIINASKLFVTR